MSKFTASWFVQFKSQLVKNFLLKWRSPWRMIFELLVPIILLGVLAAIKTTVDDESQGATEYSNMSWNIPTTQDFLNFPTNISSDIEDVSKIPGLINNYSWYVQYANQFVQHGGSNFAWLCYVGGDSNVFESDGCQPLKFAILPETSDSSSLNSTAEAFKNYWIKQYPEIQERLVDIVDQAALDSYIGSSDYGTSSMPPLGLAIVFNEAAPNWRYSIRVNSTANYNDNGPVVNVPKTSKNAKTVNNLNVGLSSYTNQYLMSGFLTIQQEIDSFIISTSTNDVNFTVNTNVFPMPTPAYTTDPFWVNTASTFGLFMMLSMLYPVAMVITQLVAEKDTKVRELMLMMGLRPLVHHFAWLFVYMLGYLILSAVLTGVSKINLFVFSETGVIFVYFLLFTYSSLAFSFFIASIFERTNVSVVVGLLVYFIGYFLYAALSGSDMSVGPQILVSLIPSAAFCFGTEAISEFEGGLVGVRWSNVAESSQTDYTMAICFAMMIIDIILYVGLGLYLDEVLPSSLGASRRKWWFLCGCCCRRRSKQQEKIDYLQHVENVARIESEHENTVFQPVTETMKSLRKEGRCVMLSDISKLYKSDKGTVHAVKNLSATFYEGQITALLGPNGAGKSTVINMLCGLVSISDGNGFVGGLPCKGEMNQIRSSLGVCPQNNVLFPDLTVREHLKIFAGVKGVHNVDDEIKSMIAEVGLTTKTDVRSRDLSGGMKRKLQLAIALFGDSKIVVLDEPTSGMDPYSRRFTWDTIERHRDGRTIILTTHFMDEADLLGDRIAIMSRGEMTCVGTSLFLKDRFGVGYQMTIEKSNMDNAKLVEKVRQYVPSATIITNIGSELTLQLPLNASAVFEDMLIELDNKKQEFHIINTSISVTTLELVFLRVANGVNPDVAPQQTEDSDAHLALKDTEKPVTTDDMRKMEPDFDLVEPSFSTQMNGLLKKRFQYAKRDRKAWCCQFVTPILFLLLGFITFKITPSSNPLELWFDNSTDFWNLPNNPNPIPFNNLNYSTPSSPNIMNFAQMPRIQLQEFDNIANEQMPYCQTEYWVEKNLNQTLKVIQSLVSVDVSSFTNTLVQLIGNLPSTPPICDSASIYNTSTKLFSNNLASTTGNSLGSRYGSLLYGILPNSTGVDYSISYNSSGIHAAPQMMNMADSAILQQKLGTSFSISTASYAFPKTQSELAIAAGFIAFTAALAIAIAFSFVPSSFAVFIVREKEQKSWHQQLINGVFPSAYWLSSWIFDFATYLIPSFFAWIFIAAFDVQVLRNEFGLVILIFILYGISITSFTYCCTYMFENHRYSQFAMIGINLFSGMILLVAAFTMTLVESTYKINDVLMYFYRLLPTFSFAHGLLQIANLEINQYLLNSVQRGGNPSNPVIYKPIDLQIAGTDVLYLAIECVAYSLLLVFLQNRYRVGVVNCSCNCLKACTSCRKPAVESEKADSANNGPEEDADVVQEASRIDGLVSSGDLNVKSENRLESGFAFDDAVILHNLRKVYPARNGKQKEKVAVKSLSLGIHRNECFGLLGINGAGKTTTLSILSGDFPPTSGEAFIDNCDVVSNLSQAQKRFGYCPQFDAIFDLLTAREHLQFYGRMKGVPENVLDVVVENKIQELGLSLHADKMAGGYSGGNKRKLSVAMATIGKPSVVFLDEPSTGMDPVSRRFMWDVISMIAERSSVILTTHSMEECEALCSRIGIMVDGGLRCLGTSQHLKNVYGSGYQLEINVKVPTSVNVEETLKIWNLNDNSTVTDNEVRHTIGDSLFEKCFSETGSANLLYQQLIHGKGSVEAKSLAEWYYVEMAQENIEKVLEEHFPGYGLLERQGVRFRYSLPAIDDLPLAKMFGIIETNRDICNIQGYSLGQTTLESVFNTFASKQDTTD